MTGTEVMGEDWSGPVSLTLARKLVVVAPGGCTHLKMWEI